MQISIDFWSLTRAVAIVGYAAMHYALFSTQGFLTETPPPCEVYENYASWETSVQEYARIVRMAEKASAHA